ncbi:MAG TPA: GYF domain-containing protein [Schlesneria sp.]
MSEQWYYRIFGEQFGPIPLEGLKELAENGTIHAIDQVRSSSSGAWVDAASVEELSPSTSERGNLAVATLTSDIEISTHQSFNNDEWFCLLGDHELGPLSFDELLQFAEQEQLRADDQVKLGSSGKWRRAGSIGRLMAALPYIVHEKKIVPALQRPAAKHAKKSDPNQSTIPIPMPPRSTPTPVVVPDPELTYRLAYEQAKTNIMESMLAQADATSKTAEEQAQAQVAWASAPNVEKFWWGWSGGVEFGPVEFSQVFGLAKIGQLKPSDFVRNGPFAQHVSSSSVPGLFQAVDMIARASAARDIARSLIQAAASLAAPPAPIDPANLVKPVVAPTPEPEPLQRSYATSASGGYSSMGGGFSSTSTMSTYGMDRLAPAPMPSKAFPKKNASSSSGSSWFSDMFESLNLKDPKTLGSLALIAFIGLVLGWGYQPKNRGPNAKKYQALNQRLKEIQEKKSSGSNPAPPQSSGG